MARLGKRKVAENNAGYGKKQNSGIEEFFIVELCRISYKSL